MRAGSMPPITSTTTSARRDQVEGVGGEQVGVDAGVAAPGGPAHGDADQLERAPDPGGEVDGVAGEQPRDLGADHAAAQQGHPQRGDHVPVTHVAHPSIIPPVHLMTARRPAIRTSADDFTGRTTYRRGSHAS